MKERCTIPASFDWNAARRPGKALVFVVIALPVVFAILGLVLDVGLMTSDSQNLKHAVDAAATAAAMDLLLGKSAGEASTTASDYLLQRNGASTNQVTVNIPPTQGPYAGQNGFLEIIATQDYATRVIHLVGAASQQLLSVRSVAGHRAATAGTAIVVLDPNPQPISVTGLPIALPLPLPALLGGLEILGVGSVRVNGAVLVNTEWGGVDQDGRPAGDGPGPPYGIACMPVISTTRLAAQDIRVAGGVDNPNNYGPYAADGDPPLRANRLPVPDPFMSLPVPTTAADPANVNATLRGHVAVSGIPLVSPPIVLEPGVYESITVISGAAVFQPGVYIIRGKNPITQLSLSLAAGTITANGVLFYITDSPSYEAASGAPDSADGETTPPHLLSAGTPSVVIDAGLLNSSFSPLASPGSPFDGMLIYQRRWDSRPIVLVHQALVGSGALSGTIYAKWGHTLFVGNSTYNMRIVSGTVRLITVANITFDPTSTLPPARDVFLVE